MENDREEKRLARGAPGNPESEASKELVRMRRKWIGIHWGAEPKPEEYHSLAQGYLQDGRFVKYYDEAAGESATRFLVEAILQNIKE